MVARFQLVACGLTLGLFAIPAPIAEADEPAAISIPKTSGTVLWSALTAGDTPQVVADKLAAMQEIKSVRLKRKIDSQGEGLSISYRDEGITVLEEKLTLKPLFKDGRLSEVILSEVNTCANDMAARYSRIRTVLKSKYTGQGIASETFSEMVFSSKRYAATPESPTRYIEILTSDDVAVQVEIMFSRTDRPDIVYSSDSFIRALASINQELYDAKSKECGGTGRYRASLGIRYMTLDGLKAEVMPAIERAKAAQAEAIGKL